MENYDPTHTAELSTQQRGSLVAQAMNITRKCGNGTIYAAIETHAKELERSNVPPNLRYLFTIVATIALNGHERGLLDLRAYHTALGDAKSPADIVAKLEKELSQRALKTLRTISDFRSQ